MDSQELFLYQRYYFGEICKTLQGLNIGIKE